MKTRYFIAIAAALSLLTGCSGGGGSDAAGISAEIDGSHSVTMEWIDSRGRDVEFSGVMQIQQTGGILSGNISITADISQPEGCFRGGEISGQVNGTGFSLAWDDIAGDSISVNGSVVGRELDGTFISTDTDTVTDMDGNISNAGNGCSSRSGSFRTTF